VLARDLGIRIEALAHLAAFGREAAALMRALSLDPEEVRQPNPE